jgi:transmembrane sensor
MMAHTNKRVDAETLHTAADWWVRLRAPHVPDETMEQWLDWTALDERNLDAYERVTDLANRLGTLDADAQRQFVNEFAPAAAPSRRWIPLAVAASFVALITLGGVLSWNQYGASHASQVYRSAVAQNQDFMLPDGSKVALGGDSTLTARFESGKRVVELSKGEAFFQVVHDARRPFVVAVGNVSIRDVGTAFDVRRTGQHVTIAVTEGRVHIADNGNVSASDANNTGTLEAVAGQLVSYDPATSAMTVSSTTAEDATAWRTDRLEFVNEPLGVVVANINRYSVRPLRIADADLETLTYTGTIKTDAIDHWLVALPQVFPLRVDVGADEVTLANARRK